MRTRLTLAALVLAATVASVAAETSLVRFAVPQDGAVVSEPQVTVSGRAETPPRPAATFDVVLLIDTSGSTRNPASVAGGAQPRPAWTSWSAAGRRSSTPR
jgi:hypothetical protein